MEASGSSAAFGGPGGCIEGGERMGSGNERECSKNQAAVELGRLGGKVGGPARARKLTREQRSEIARHAAKERWRSKKGINMLRWTKTLTASEAIRPRQGAPMPFI